MGWLQEVQYRHQYSTDDRTQMEWQPTAVWRPDRKIYSSSSLSVEDWINCLLFVTAVIATIVIYNFVGNIGFVEHLPSWLRGLTLLATLMISFIGSMKFLYSEIVKALVLFVVCGFFAFCVGCIVVPIIWQLL